MMSMEKVDTKRKEELQSLIDTLTAENAALQDELNMLKEIGDDENENLRALLRLQTIVLATMGVMQPYCFEDSEYGVPIAKNIMQYYKNTLTSLHDSNRDGSED